MLAQSLYIERMIEAAKAAREGGANITLEPGGFAVRANAIEVLVGYSDVEHSIDNPLLATVQKVTG